jgi:hypothetical protein
MSCFVELSADAFQIQEKLKQYSKCKQPRIVDDFLIFVNKFKYL